MTEDEAFVWLRSSPEKAEVVRDCYYDDPVAAAADRFYQSAEWRAVRAGLRGHTGSKVLDLGAGRGIASYALYRSGFSVVALEPGMSPLLGARAITSLAREARVRIPVVCGWGERLPFADDTFDVVYGRAVLHHTADLAACCREVARVLRPGGSLVATREHVVSRHEDVAAFLAEHREYAGHDRENALMLREYISAIASAGIRIRRVVGPYESAINYYPWSEARFTEAVVGLLARIAGRSIARVLSRRPAIRNLAGTYLTLRSSAPGRLYSFFGTKP